jgi:hypothetical protein
MPKTNERQSPNPKAGASTPDVLWHLQHLLLALKDIDLAYESDLEVVRASAANEDLKTVAMGNLRQLHDRRRAPIVRQLTKLEERLRA